MFVAGNRPGLGHIVYAEAGRLMAVPFDAVRRVVKGGAIPIVENVDMRPNGDWASYSMSSTGTLVFREGTLHELVSIDSGSGAVRLFNEPAPVRAPAFVAGWQTSRDGNSGLAAPDLDARHRARCAHATDDGVNRQSQLRLGAGRSPRSSTR
jgi:hypothetical protein